MQQTTAPDVFSTHLPTLEAIADHFGPALGPVIEYGPGLYSTKLLLRTAALLVSVEQGQNVPDSVNRQWLDRIRESYLGGCNWMLLVTPAVDGWRDLVMPAANLVFVDGRGQTRVDIVLRHMSEGYRTIVAHDTEEPSYGWSRIATPKGYREIQHRQNVPWTTTWTSDNALADALLKLPGMIELGTDNKLTAVFNEIYRTNAWGGGSGSGSTPAYTAKWRAWLAEYIKANRIRSILDIGCGDWQSTQLMDFTDVHYTGMDPSSDIIAENRRKYAKPGVVFMNTNAVDHALPPADLVLIKDVLEHLSFDSIRKVLARLAGYAHVLIVDDIHGIPNQDKPDGGCRGVDVRLAPFNLPADVAFTFDNGIKTCLVSRELYGDTGTR